MKPRRKRSTLKLVSAGDSPRSRIPSLVPPGSGLVRLARVAEARRRIASGWYDRAEVRDRLVEAVLEEIRAH